MDRYLLSFVTEKLKRTELQKSIIAVKGIDGVVGDDTIEGAVNDEFVKEKYRKLDRIRDDEIGNLIAPDVDDLPDDLPREKN